MMKRGDGDVSATSYGIHNTSALIVMMHLQLPVRKEITLSEAVTAFVYGKPRDPPSGPLYPSYASDVLLEQLHRAARAGQVRFRALKIGKNKYQEIKPSSFRKTRRFNWGKIKLSTWCRTITQKTPSTLGRSRWNGMMFTLTGSSSRRC